MNIFNKKINIFRSLLYIIKMKSFIFFILTFFSIVLSLMPAFKIYLLSKIINIISTSNEKNFFVFCFIYFFVIIFQHLYPLIQKILEKIIDNNLNEDILCGILNLILNKEYIYFENSNYLNSFNRCLENPSYEFINYYKNIISLFVNILQLFSIILMISKTSIYLSFLLMFILILLILISHIGGKKEYIEDFKSQKNKRFANYLEEILTSQDFSEERVIFKTHKNIIPKFINKSVKVFNIELKAKKYWLSTSLKSGILSTSLLLIIVLLLIFPLKNNNLSLGLYIAFVNSIIVLIPTLSWNIPTNIKEISKTNEFFNEINKIILLDDEKDLGEKHLNSIESVEFKDVTFKYPESEKIILDNVSFKLQKGKTYALVGINGAGKSTIIKLILGLYENFYGEILINQKDIKSFKKESIRKNISLVFQDFSEYSISIKENIILNKKYDEDLFEKVLKDTFLIEKISSLNSGINTVLGKKMEESFDFSGGQWQKLAIARCIYNSKSLNIFDEPTSKIDANTELKILDTITQKNKNSISLIISHKLGSLKNLDEIIVINNKKIIEIGSFDTLISKKNFFYGMYKKQKEFYNYE